MKNFLKSTAIFACIALMFAACSEDTTEDAAVSVSVPAPVIESIQPGKGTIVVEWYIPDDCDADKSMITWKNLDAATTADDGQTNQFVKEGVSYTYTIGTDIPLASVGNYEVSIYNVHATTQTRSEAVSQTVLVYTDAIYASSMPVPSSYSYDETTGVTIYWSEIDADCQGVVITYTYVDIDGNDQLNTTELMSLADGSTTIADAKIGTDFTFSGFFCPEGAVDMVEVTGGEGTISDTPSGVTSLSVVAGVETLTVTWDLSDAVLEDDLEAMLVTYTDSSSNVTEVLISTTDMTFASSNSYEIENVPVGTYTVSIYSVKSGYFLSDVTTASSTVTVYNESSFTLPTISTIENSNSSVVTITWFEAPTSCTGWYIKYQMTDGEMSGAVTVDVTDGVAANTVFTDAKEFGKIEVYASYLPSGSTVSVYLEGELEETIPVAAAATPTLYQPTTSYTESGESEITLTWNIADPDGLVSTMIYFADNSAETLEYTEIEVLNPVRGDGNTYTLTSDDGIATSTEYNIYIKSKRDNSDATLSAASDDYDVLAYNADEFTLADIPIPAAVLDETLSVLGSENAAGCNAMISWTCDKIAYVVEAVIEYEGVEYGSVEEYDEDGNRSVVTYFPVTDTSKTTYTYVSVDFYPIGGDATVTVPYTGTAIPTITMTDPTSVAVANVAVTPVFEQAETNFGETATGASKIKVEWTTDVVASYFLVSYGETSTLGNTKNVYYADSTSSEYTVEQVVEYDEDGTVIPSTTLQLTYKYTMYLDCTITDGTTYGATIQSVSALGRTALATSEQSATAYGITTFYEAPEVRSISISNGGDGSANVKWEDSIDGLQSLVVAYEKTNGSFASVDAVIDGAYIATTNLPSAAVGKTITYVATFCAEGGEGDIVYKVTSTEVSAMTNNPYVPTSMSVESFGYSLTSNKPYFNLSWTPSDIYPEAEAYYVFYSNDGECPDDDDYAAIVTSASCKLELGETEIGSYTIYVRAATYATDGTGAVYLSDDYVSASVTSYNTNYYSDADLPTALAYLEDTIVSIEWSNVSSDVKSVTVTYNGSTVLNGAAITEGQVSTFNYMTDVSSYTYVATLAPAGGIEVVTLDTGAGTFTVSSSDIEWSDDDSAYLIYTAKGLAAFADITNGTTTYLGDDELVVNGTFTPSSTSKNTYANGIVMKPIDLSTICSATLGNWTPIASYGGTFDGGGYKISNLYIYTTSGNQGFINALSGGTVKNVVMNNSIIYASSVNGTIAATATTTSLIENCSVIGTSTVTGTSITNGGIVGNLSGVAKNCYTGPDMTVIGTGAGISQGSAGGIAGVASNTAAFVIGCHNAATVSGSRSTAGLVGYSTSVTMIGSCNTGTIVDTSTGQCGGLGGRFYPAADGRAIAFIGCYNAGTIQNIGTQSAGIMGVCTVTTTMAGVFNVGDVVTASTSGAFNGYNASAVTTYTSCYYVPTATISWAVANSSTADPDGITQVGAYSATNQSYADLNARVDEMNAAIIAAGYGPDSDHYYQFVAGATDLDYPTIVEIK